MDLVVKEKLVLVERRISLSEFHTADEVFMLTLSSFFEKFPEKNKAPAFTL